MTAAWQALPERLAEVRRLVAASATRVGRDPACVRVVAVTKTFPPAAVEAVVAAGLSDVGENYVQEARDKRAAARVSATWHLIGGLQRNKVAAAVRLFDWIHAIDDERLAEALGGAAQAPVHVLVQVNVSGDPARRGVTPARALAVARAVLAMPLLVLEGVMAMGRPEASGEAVRAGFRRAREVRDDLASRLGVDLPHLSMGMSDDFPIAVEEGATLLRLGRILFGSRGAGSWREGT